MPHEIGGHNTYYASALRNRHCVPRFRKGGHDGSPAGKFRYLYPFGAIRMNLDRTMYRTQGIVRTIKDGVVINNAAVMEEVADIGAESKQDAGPDIMTEPFLVND